MDLQDRIAHLPRHPHHTYATRPLHRIRSIDVYPTATEGGRASTFAIYHVKRLDWPGIGYHFVIHRDGTVERSQTLRTACYHGDATMTGVAIGVVAPNGKQSFTDAQQQALLRLMEATAKELPDAMAPRDVVYHEEPPAASAPRR